MTATLAAALDALVDVARRAGLDADAARAEGEALAAAVAEPAVGAYGAWASELGRTPNAQDFFAAAQRGRRWRVSPTTLLSQLAVTAPAAAGEYAAALGQVCTAATALGEPNLQATQAALGAAAAQLAATSPAQPSGPASEAFPGLGGPGAPSAADLTGGLLTGPARIPAGIDPTLLTKLTESQDRLKAMEDFAQAGPGILGGVLDQLKANADRIKALRDGDLGLVPPAGSDTGRPGGVPTQPVDPAQPGAPGTPDDPAQAGAAAPTQAQADPNAPQPEAKPTEPEKTVDELLAELDALVGLDAVKAEIHRQTAVLKVGALREKAGLKNATLTRHLVFVGNPGTGKTTVARLVGGIYKALGLLSKGQLVEVDRSELVAGYLGQTALKTAEVCKSAVGGVLFIDEAYSLSGDQYGEEAINTLVKEMEDNRSDLVVIVAGYPRPMATFIAENPGLASRFRTTIDFADYTDEELFGIFQLMVDKADYALGEGALDAFKTLLGQQLRDETFGNGRFARNVMEAAIGHQAWRLRENESPSVDDLRTLTAEDVLGDAAVPPVEFGPADAASDPAPGGAPGLTPLAAPEQGVAPEDGDPATRVPGMPGGADANPQPGDPVAPTDEPVRIDAPAIPDVGSDPDAPASPVPPAPTPDAPAQPGEPAPAPDSDPEPKEARA